MGKSHQLPLQRKKDHQETTGSETASNSTLFGERCMFCCSRFSKEFNLKCLIILVLSLAVLISAIFWLIPVRHKHYGFESFDAIASIKHRAIVQVYFELDKPVATIIPYIKELEYDIYSEIGVPYLKVAVLSMHEGIESNRTDVVIGFLSDPIDVSINTVSLSILKASLLALFMEEYNLTLTKSLGQISSSSFQISKFPMGITMIPEKNAPDWKNPQILFKFTMNNSIYEVKEKLDELKEQLKLSLLLRQYENVYLQVRNRNGSTKDPPVRVRASITSNISDGLSPHRLKQLARIIRNYSASKNLDLNHFGKVKEISLSSFLNHSIHAMPPCSNCHAHPPSNHHHHHPHHHNHHHHIHGSSSHHSIAPSPSNPVDTYSPGPRQERVYPCEGPVAAPSVSCKFITMPIWKHIMGWDLDLIY
ncbi:uncharacterized protein LOC124941850 [Impatiens glandulifera]|uniref:uncharacterized protein LOC124941850 n=1 Tax=Impatiens glandulifera TaxID=253017 RepID=UPI001FB0F78D|nr:uncharacterized protein LOC124941850 [Impatiens glandulifera]